MKKNFLVLALCMGAIVANATIVTDETFTDFPDNWTTTGSVTTGNARSVVDPLSYSNSGGTFCLSKQGKAVKSAHDAADKYFHVKALPDSITTGTFYLSYIYRADGEVKASNSQVLGLSETTSAAAVRLWVGKDVSVPQNKAMCRMGITRASSTSGDIQWGSELFSIDETHLIVIKYNIEDSVASLYVDPVIGGTEPVAALAVDGTKGSAKKVFKYLCLYATGNTKTYCTFGGARVSTPGAEAVAAGKDEPKEDPEYANGIIANFSDSTIWTNCLDATPTSGQFPTDTLNDYILTATAVVKSSKTLYFDKDSTEYVKFSARAHEDKSTYSASIETPWVAGVDTLFLYAQSGTDGKDFKVQYRVANGKWTDLATLTNTKTTQLHAVPVNKTNLKFKIINLTTSAQQFYYIGDTNPRMFAKHTTTGLINFKSAAKVVKSVEKGQIVIFNNGKKYSVIGTEL